MNGTNESKNSKMKYALRQSKKEAISKSVLEWSTEEHLVREELP